MTDRVIVTASDRLGAVLDELALIAAERGWHVVAPVDAEAVELSARAGLAAGRLPRPVVVTVVADDGSRADAGALLRRHPVAGAVADAVRRRIPPAAD